MSVLIKGIEMPTKCNECNFCVNGFTEDAPMYECAVESGENVSVLVDDYGKPFDFRPDWCPLVEIPTPHGRLIDADELANKTFYNATSAPYITYKKFVDTPTVIEAEDN